jgi:rubrerythrin
MPIVRDALLGRASYVCPECRVPTRIARPYSEDGLTAAHSVAVRCPACGRMNYHTTPFNEVMPRAPT